jgi:hypothetical protein
LALAYTHADQELIACFILLTVCTEYSTSRENAIAGEPKRATAGPFWCADDPNAGGNSYRWRIVLFAGGKVIYCWRIVLCARGKLFHWRMKLCAGDKRALRWRIFMRQGQCFYVLAKIIAAVKNKILYSRYAANI